MLSIGKVGPDNKTYHLDQIADSAEEYYSGRGEAHGEWLGIEMDTYEVSGKVRPEAFSRLLEGVKGDGSGELFSKSFSRREVLAFDLTFSAPKSVSLMYAAGSEHVKTQVVEAHDVAVRAGFSYIERAASWGRARKDGELHPYAGAGLFGAAFRHRTNRLGEPQLHSHVVTPNMIKIGKDHWTTIDSKRIYHHAKAGGTIYQAALRRELTKRLGVKWGEQTKGQADVEGISREVIEAFSTRADEIQADMHELGFSSMVQGKASAVKTRLSKDQSKAQQDIFEAWESELVKNGLTEDSVDSLCDQMARLTRVTAAEQREIFKELELLGARAYTDRRLVLQAIADLAPATAGADALERIADDWIEHVGVVISERGHGPVDDVKKLLASGNRVITTEAQIELEASVLSQMKSRMGSGAGVVSEAAIEHGLKVQGKLLSPEQKAMVQSILSSGNGIDVVVGDAGTGKTFALNCLRTIYENDGYKVYGGALSARASRELGDGANVSSETIHRTLALLDKQEIFGHKSVKNSVFLIDEAGMLDTQLLARVLDHPSAKHTKIVLVGDDKQLPPIGPGGVFRAAAERFGSSRLSENRRQRDPIDQAIVADFRDGQGAAGLARAKLHGRLTITESHAEALDAVYSGWSSEANPSECLMIAGLRSEVYELNTRAQADRLARGELGEVELRCGAYSFRVGDSVRCGARNKSWQVANGDFGTVVAVDIENHTATIELRVGGETKRVKLDTDYVNDPEAFKLGYAITGHTSQGATCENAWTLMNDRTYRELGYTQSSRARGQTHIVVVGALVVDPDAPGYDPSHTPTEFDSVVAALRRSQAQAMALDVGKPDAFAGVPTDELVAEIAASRAPLGVKASGQPGKEAREAEAQRYRDLINEVKLRTELSVREMLAKPPRYLVSELGPVPEDPAQREYWRRGAMEIELFRTRWGIRSQTNAWLFDSRRSPAPKSPELLDLAGRQRVAALKRMLTHKKAIEQAPLKIKGPSL